MKLVDVKQAMLLKKRGGRCETDFDFFVSTLVLNNSDVNRDLVSDHVEANSSAEERVQGGNGAEDGNKGAGCNGDETDSQDSFGHYRFDVASQDTFGEDLCDNVHWDEGEGRNAADKNGDIHDG